MPKYTRSQMAEDLIAKASEAATLALEISSELNDGVNPPETSQAWDNVYVDLTKIAQRAMKLAR